MSEATTLTRGAYGIEAEGSMTATETPPTSVLVVEDTPEIARLIRRSLMLEGYQVDVAEDGRSALAAIRDQPPDLIVLDLMLPDIDGIEITRRVRALEEADHLLPLPILMVTALDDIQDRVSGLDAGADDYLPKPFAIPELVARVKALLRRSTHARDAGAGLGSADRLGDVLRYEDLTMDFTARTVARGERPVALTAREFDLLSLFMRHPNQVMTHQQLMQRVWGDDFFGESNVLAVTIGAVRRALEEGGERRLIQTVRGVGYVLRSQP
ncbi:MAG TPA: response regulator transcription factor [Thermomicrobiales bacterium]|nr:response regulator transcription factor [Thermomicrobiales bacterium]